MEIKRKFEMLVATNRRYVVRQSASAKQIVCAECGAPVLTPEQAAGMFNITQRRIFQIIEAGAAHFTETEAGALIICLNSLAIFLEADERK